MVSYHLGYTDTKSKYWDRSYSQWKSLATWGNSLEALCNGIPAVRSRDYITSSLRGQTKYITDEISERKPYVTPLVEEKNAPVPHCCDSCPIVEYM